MIVRVGWYELDEVTLQWVRRVKEFEKVEEAQEFTRAIRATAVRGVTVSIVNSECK